MKEFDAELIEKTIAAAKRHSKRLKIIVIIV
jgi:hypothetical protein